MTLIISTVEDIVKSEMNTGIEVRVGMVSKTKTAATKVPLNTNTQVNLQHYTKLMLNPKQVNKI